MDLETLVSQLASKVGLSAEQAQVVVAFLTEHKDEVMGALGSGALDAVKDKLPGGLGGLLGG